MCVHLQSRAVSSALLLLSLLTNPAASWFHIAAAQRFPSGSTGVPCNYVRNLGIRYLQRGSRCYVIRSGQGVNTARQLTDIIGGGIHTVEHAVRAGMGYSRAAGRMVAGQERAASPFVGYIGNPYTLGFPGGIYGGFSTIGRRRSLQQANPESGVAADVTCPINASDLKDRMKLLVEPCSVSVDDNAIFCQQCLRPMQILLASKYHGDMLMGKHTYDVAPEDEKQVATTCTLDALRYMEEQLVIPVSDDNFLVNVLLCKSFHKDANCPLDVQDFATSGPLSDMLLGCHDHLTEQVSPAGPPPSATAIASIPSYIWGLTAGHLIKLAGMPNKSNVGEPGYIRSLDNSTYCSACYYPFYEIMMHRATSDEFWCEYADMVNRTNNAMTVDTFHAALVQDGQFISCLLNAMHYLEFHDETMRNPFGGDNKQSVITNVCWKQENYPKTSWFSNDDWKEIMQKPCTTTMAAV